MTGSPSTYRIVYKRSGRQYKLVRVGFTADGSYYVTSPYHPESKALLWLATVNYTLDESRMTFDEAIELASADDDQRALKLSHHISGLYPDSTLMGNRKVWQSTLIR